LINEVKNGRWKKGGFAGTPSTKIRKSAAERNPRSRRNIEEKLGESGPLFKKVQERGDATTGTFCPPQILPHE